MPLTPQRLRALSATIDALVRLRPGRAAERLSADCQRHVLACLLPGGARPAARLRDALKGRYPHSQAHTLPGMWMWRLELESPRRALDLTLHARGVYFSYGLLETPSPRRERRHASQDRFYARWLEVGQRAYAPGARVRLSPADRLVLLVGELEADVNNGGFDQYLLNKGRRRALHALAALRRIGARRTAALLDSALDPKATREALDALDRRFYRVPEDLALAVIRHLDRTSVGERAGRGTPARAGSGRGARR